ncbi:unnamed protein product [Lota lota]
MTHSDAKRSAIAADALKINQKMLQLPQHKLVTDVVVHWNSAFERLSRFLEQQPAICAALLSPEQRFRYQPVNRL